jgi:S-adenosylmethionine-dependent methyltransferase
LVHVQERERIAPARQTVLWRLLTQALEQVRLPGRPVRVLDCGGGSGRFAVPLAQLGAEVTVVDVSVDALATLHRRAAEAEVGASITAVQGEVEALDEVVARATFDLVLAHAVLESVDSAERALTAVASAVRPGGLVSVLFDNPVAAVLSRVLAGDLAAALNELTQVPARAPLDLIRVAHLCRQVGLEVQATHGIEVFTEWLPGLVADAGAADRQLAELEELAAVRSPYRDLAARQHILAQRPTPGPSEAGPSKPGPSEAGLGQVGLSEVGPSRFENGLG